LSTASIVFASPRSAEKRSLRARANPLLPALFVVLWSTGFISAKYGLPYAPPLKYLLVRFALAAALMLLVAGGFSLVYGLAAVLNDQVVTVGGRGVLVWDFTVWGWVHMVVGAIMLLTCWGLFALKGFARWTAIFIAIVNAMVQMATITAFPLWAITIITLDVIIIYQLTVNWAKDPAY